MRQLPLPLNRLFPALAALAVGGALLLAGCGGGADRTKAQVRLVNASPDYTQLDLRANNTVVQPGVAYGGAAGYAEVDPDDLPLTVHSAGSATPLVSLSPRLSERRHYTLLALGNAGSLRQLLLDDALGQPPDGKTQLRVVNAAADAGSLDVYLTATGESLTAATATVGGAGFGVVTAPANVDSGTWRLRVTAAGSKTDLRLDLPSVSLGARETVTLVLTPGRGGVLVNALLLVQQGAIAQQANTQARVRLAALVTQTATVAASASGTVLSSGAASYAVGDYQLVPAATAAPVTVSVNGSALATAPRDLPAGSDHTLLVYGPAGSASVAWLADDNRRPVDGTRTKLRLVHALADSAAQLALTLDFAPLADSVNRGEASAYAAATPTSGTGGSGALTVTASGLPAPVYSVANQQFVANGVYTLFLAGPIAGPTAVVRADR